MNKEENKAIFKEKEWWWLLNTSISLRRLFSMIENERKLTMENDFLGNCWFWKIVWSALNFVLKEEGEAWKVQYYYLMDGGLNWSCMDSVVTLSKHHFNLLIRRSNSNLHKLINKWLSSC